MATAENYVSRKNFGKSLADIKKDMGVVAVREVPLETLKEGTLRFYREHEKAPTHFSGDATLYLGINVPWSSVPDICRRQHDISFHQLKKDLGIPVRNYDGLPLEIIEKGITLFIEQHNRPPSIREKKDAYPYVGVHVKWSGVFQALRKIHGLTYRELKDKMGLTTRRPSRYSVTELAAAINAYIKEHGRPPTEKDGDASRYFNLPENMFS